MGGVGGANLNVDFVPRNGFQNKELGSLNVQTEMYFYCFLFLRQELDDFTMFQLLIPEIINCAVSCGQNEAVEGEALHVVGLGGSFELKKSNKQLATSINVWMEVLDERATNQVDNVRQLL